MGTVGISASGGAIRDASDADTTALSEKDGSEAIVVEGATVVEAAVVGAAVVALAAVVVGAEAAVVGAAVVGDTAA